MLTIYDRPFSDRPEGSLAIYVKHEEKFCHCFLISGAWLHRRPREFNFAVPRFVPVSQARALIPFIPLMSKSRAKETQSVNASVPRELGGPLNEQMIKFQRRADATYRRFSAALDNAHDAVADESAVRFVTLSEIADAVFGEDLPGEKRSPSDMYALHKVLVRDGSGFFVEPNNHRRSELFEVRPKEEVRQFKRVEAWFRQYHEAQLAERNRQTIDSAGVRHAESEDLSRSGRSTPALKNSDLPMARFLDVARRLIVSSRRMRTPTKMSTALSTSVGPGVNGNANQPVRMVDTGVVFSDTDRVIIRFIQAWSGTNRIRANSRSSSLSSLILRASGMYQGYDLDQASGYLFLQEIGVYTPWENRFILGDRFHLANPSRFGQSSAQLNRAGEADDFEGLEDGMADLRRDLGDTAVYCIDRRGSSDVEDGVSIERVPGPVESYWLHTHIAHPTAFIDPSHPIAVRARRQIVSMYLPEGVYPMLPGDWVDRRLRLAPGGLVLTFSVRVDADGAILEERIAPGRLRKVIHVDPNSLNKHVAVGTNWLARDDKLKILVGAERPWIEGLDLRNFEELEPQQQDDLRQLLSLCKMLQRRRAPPEKTNYSYLMRNIHVFRGDEAAMEMDRRDGDRGLFWAGDPGIRLATWRWESLGPGAMGVERAHQLLAELMVVASQTAARFCHARGIPAPFRGSVGRNLESTEQTPENHRFLSSYSAEAVRHDTMNVDMYVRTTSPLRRFSDMITHWQIDAALRHEAGASSSSSPSSSSLAAVVPFSRADIESTNRWLELRSKFLTEVGTRSQQHWLCQLLIRAVFLQEAILPPVLPCFIVETNNFRGSVVGCLKDIQMLCRVELVPGLTTPTVARYDEFEVEIVRIDAYACVIEVRPVRLVRRAEEQSELDLWRMTQLGF